MTCNVRMKTVKILVEQEAIDINAKTKFYFNNLVFKNNIWSFFKLFETALIIASKKATLKLLKFLKSCWIS